MPPARCEAQVQLRERSVGNRVGKGSTPLCSIDYRGFCQNSGLSRHEGKLTQKLG